MTDDWRPDLSALRHELRQIKEAFEADRVEANPTPPATTTTPTSMTLAHRPAPASFHLHPTAEVAVATAAGGKRSPTNGARPAPLVTETWAAYLPEGRDAFIARGGKTYCDDDLIEDRIRVGGQQQRADESEGQKGEIVGHYDGHADHHDYHDNIEQDDSRTDGDDDDDYVLDLRHPVVASWEGYSREKEDDEGDGSIIDSAFGGELDEDEGEEWEQGGDADEAANGADDELDETDLDSDSDSTGDEDILGGSYTLAAALALPYEVVDNDDDSEEDEEEAGGTYVLAPKYARRFKIMEVDEEMEEVVDWNDQSDLLAEWGSYSDYYDEYGEGERVRKKARVA